MAKGRPYIQKDSLFAPRRLRELGLAIRSTKKARLNKRPFSAWGNGRLAEYRARCASRAEFRSYCLTEGDLSPLTPSGCRQYTLGRAIVTDRLVPSDPSVPCQWT
jgi:hypothetical protein